MAEYAEKDRGFGLMRALNRVRTPGKVSQIVETAEIKTPRTASAPRRDRSPTEVAEAQRDLKRQVTQQNTLELWPLPGLAPMTRVRTNFGDVHAITLRKGDKVLLKGGQYRAIEWVNRIMLEEHILKLKPDSNPILLAPGSLSPGVPAHDVMVSPRQIFCADDRTGLTKEREAAMLLSRSGIRRIKETGLTYTMFHVGETADVYCEGVYLRFPIET